MSCLRSQILYEEVAIRIKYDYGLERRSFKSTKEGI